MNISLIPYQITLKSNLFFNEMQYPVFVNHEDKSPIISVVMPVFNAERYLPEAIGSILEQTHTDFEFIIIDDHSTDSSSAILEKFSRNDHRIRIIKNSENRGVARSLNSGISSARGEWIARMDADDIAMPNRFEEQLRAVTNNPGLVLVGSQIEVIDSENRTVPAPRSISKLPQVHSEIVDSLIRGLWPIVHPTVMMKRAAVEKLGGYRICALEDHDLFLRLSQQGELKNLTDVLLHYRLHDTSATKRINSGVGKTEKYWITRLARPELPFEFLGKAFPSPWTSRKPKQDIIGSTFRGWRTPIDPTITSKISKSTRIFFENGSHDMLNLGDMAMLKVCVERFSREWPEAALFVTCDDAERCREILPGAIPVQLKNEIRGEPPRIMGLSLPRSKIWEKIRRVKLLIGDTITKRTRFYVNIDEVHPDVFVVAGGGFINETFAGIALGIFRVLDQNNAFEMPTAIFGQGIGPLDSDSLLAAVIKYLFPHLAAVGLREAATSPALASQAGAPANRVRVTGDDAIEIALDDRATKLGNGLGINIRVADYTKVSDEKVFELRQCLHELCQNLSTKIYPLPISFNRWHSDVYSLDKLIDGLECVAHPPQRESDLKKYFETLSQCRLVITGSYHAAIFALSRGIPAIGLYQNAYYSQKFAGVKIQFGAGFESICLENSDSFSKLKSTASEMWFAAESFRPQLIDRAHAQCAASRELYKGFIATAKEMVSRRNPIQYPAESESRAVT